MKSAPSASDSKILYPVMETFSTLQGEGFYTGSAAWFIRLSGCDVGCVWCDVKESWTTAPEQFQDLETLVAQAKKHPGKIIVITGGEPAIYDLEPIISRLQGEGFKVHIETSGAYPITGNADWITVSPKKFKGPLPAVMAKASELKIVVFNKSDLEWAEQHRETVSTDCQLYLQPEHSKLNASVNLILDYISVHPEWKLSLQTHKFIGIP
jgi:7-carboxy-7-deazaguanine synthase